MEDRRAAQAATARHRARVQRLERFAAASPRAYLVRVLLLALSGYGFLIGLLLLLAAAPLAIAWRVFVQGVRFEPQLAIVLLIAGAGIAALVRALWVRFEVPAGRLLAPHEAPALHAEVERLRAATGAPPLSGIVIDTQLNAAAASLPRLLGLAGHRHYLVLGLPLLQLLDRDEAAAVIAHEFGHFGEQHGRLAGWLYRVRFTWYRAVEGLSRSGFLLSMPIARFYGWYAPLFDAWSFVLARAHEFRADATAARVVDRDAMTSALLRLEHGSGRMQSTLWPRVLARARVQSHPPAQLLAPLIDGLRASPHPDPARLLAIADRDVDPYDTHPVLARRLDALGAPAVLRPRGEPAAAWLGDALDGIERELDQHWRAQLRTEWQALHAAAANERARFRELDSMSVRSAEEAVEHARLFETVEIDRDPLPVLARAHAAHPDSAMAAFRLGLRQLQAGDVDGMTHLRQAVARDAGAVGPIGDALKALLRDPDVDAHTAGQIAELRDALAPRADDLRDRDAVVDGDALQPHDLDTAALGRLTATLAGHERVTRAWLACKQVAMVEASAHYVLLLDWRGSVASEAAGLRALSEALQLPGSHTVFTGSEAAAVAKQVRRLCAEPVYQKGKGQAL
ncbi:M48 family metalloprotease [Luteimonas terrae]|uniref:Zn-dependent protease with chaperone function n=1 Tax=Luteimonas terrae TaxID=1530191 RepID=A0ABU1XTG7_9GAMM|nr:M48 family metalloprotease [Luteimonas terrae]MDR7192067.1 Zn-dependent protease with chaperone function [Luteimonas terrae]